MIFLNQKEEKYSVNTLIITKQWRQEWMMIVLASLLGNMGSWIEAQAQYEHRFNASCHCGASLTNRIEWAYNKNKAEYEQWRRILPPEKMEAYVNNKNGGYILIKYCWACGKIRSNNYLNS